MTKEEALIFVTKHVAPSLLAHPELDEIRVFCPEEVFAALFEPGAQPILLIETPDQREVVAYVEREVEQTLVQRTRSTIHARLANTLPDITGT